MLNNVNACVDSAYLQLIAHGRGVHNTDEASIKNELAALLHSAHACEPSLVEKVLEEKQYWGLLAEHRERSGSIEGALKIYAGLVDGELVDAHDWQIDVPTVLSKVAALLHTQSDTNLISSYGRWLVKKDPEAGISVLTKQTAAAADRIRPRRAVLRQRYRS